MPISPPSRLSHCAVGLLAAAPAVPGLAQVRGDDPQLSGFATSVVQYAPAGGSAAGLTFADPMAALGRPDFASLSAAPFSTGVVSLGDAATGATSGSITLGFATPITDGPGDDLAVFENGFTAFNRAGFVSAELAFVEVSSDGLNFARFPSSSLNVLPDGDPDTPVSDNEIDTETFGPAFATLNPANVTGLAGTAAVAFGSDFTLGNGFDLADLAAVDTVVSGAVNPGDIRFVRILDIVGDGRAIDTSGNPIFDPFAPGSAGGGFDLDAVAAINVVPEPTTALVFLAVGPLLTRRRLA